MAEDIVRKRAKRAANVLLIRIVICSVLAFIEELGFVLKPGADPIAAVIDSLIAPCLAVAITFILIVPLKRDRVNALRVIFIVLIVIYAYAIYKAFIAYDDELIIKGLIGMAASVFNLIALYNFGKKGKIYCFVASGLSVLLALLYFITPDPSFLEFVQPASSAVFYVFLGLYVESKGMPVEEPAVEGPSAAPQAEEKQQNANRSQFVR